MAGAVRYESIIEWNGDKVTRAVGEGGAAGINMLLERLRSYAVALAPLDRGPLRESAMIVPAIATGTITGALIFDVPYAAIQHENEDYQHDQGQSHYVTDPAREHREELYGIAAKQIRIRLS